MAGSGIPKAALQALLMLEQESHGRRGSLLCPLHLQAKAKQVEQLQKEAVEQAACFPGKLQQQACTAEADTAALQEQVAAARQQADAAQQQVDSLQSDLIGVVLLAWG